MTQEAAQARRRFRIGLIGWGLAALFFFYGWILRVAPSVMVEQLMRDYAIGGAILGNLSAMYFYAYVALQTPAGLAMDRWGPRRVLAATALIAAAGCGLSAWAPNVEFAYAGRFLVGGGVAFAFVGSLMLAAAWLPPRRFAFFSGLGMGIGLLGGVAGQAPVALVVQAEGWRVALVWLGAGGLVMAAALWLLVQDRPADAAMPAATVPKESVWRGLLSVVGRRQTNFLAAYAGCLSSALLVFGALWGVPYVMERFAAARAEAAFSVSWLLIGFAIGAPLWGWISDRLGRRRAPMLAGCVLGGCGISAAIYVPGLPVDLFRVAMFLTGLGAGAMGVSYATTREHNAASATGAALGYVNMTSVIAGALLQPLVGWLFDLQWDGTQVAGARRYSLATYENGFLILPAVYVVGFFCALAVRETHCRPLPPPAAPAQK